MATSTQDWIDELKGISVLELSERIKALEEEFGVSATAVAAAAPAGGGGGGEAAAAEEEQTRVRRHPHGGRRQEDPGHQGRPRGDRPGPEGGQGARRRGSQARQRGHRPRGGRQAQGRARGGRRERRDQVGRSGRCPGFSRGTVPLGPSGSVAPRRADFRILGTARGPRRRPSRLPLGGPRAARAARAASRSMPDRTVAVDALLDDLWGDDQPPGRGEDDPRRRLAAAQGAAARRAVARARPATCLRAGRRGRARPARASSGCARRAEPPWSAPSRRPSCATLWRCGAGRLWPSSPSRSPVASAPGWRNCASAAWRTASRRTSRAASTDELVAGAGGARRGAPAARAPAPPAHARAVPLRPPGRGARRLPAISDETLDRRARHRAVRASFASSSSSMLRQEREVGRPDRAVAGGIAAAGPAGALRAQRRRVRSPTRCVGEGPLDHRARPRLGMQLPPGLGAPADRALLRAAGRDGRG